MEFDIYPPLIECFAIVLMGFICNRCNLITSTQGKGISSYICYMALPALIFQALVKVEFYSINWRLWGGLLLSKSLLFCVVCLLTFFFYKKNRIGKAGLFAIFVTQSNDFAFGLPLCK